VDAALERFAALLPLDLSRIPGINDDRRM